MMKILVPDECYDSFGEYVKARGEALGKSIRGLALELDMTSIAFMNYLEKAEMIISKT